MDTNVCQVVSSIILDELYSFVHPLPQCFSLPYPIIKYIIQNPQSPKTWKKLIKTCKYFYSKKSVLPVSYLNVFTHCSYSHFFISEPKCVPQCETDSEIFDPSTSFPNLCVYNSFVAPKFPNVVSLLMPRIVQCEVRYLHLEDQNLTWNEYQKLISSGTIQKLVLKNNVIKNADDSFVTTDKLLENFHQIETIEINSSMFQADTVKKMNQHLMGFKKLRQFKLQKLSESFDFASLTDFLMKNETVDVILNFSPVSDAYFENVRNTFKQIMKKPFLKLPLIIFQLNFD